MPNDIQLSLHAYCTFSAIQTLNPQRLYNASTSPTKAQIIDIATDWFQKINGVLDVLGYVIPVASTNGTSIRILKRLNALPVAAAAEEATYSVYNSDKSEHASRYSEQFKLEWGELTTGKLSLPGATRKSNHFPLASERQPYVTFHQINGGDEEPAVFSKNMDF